MLCVDLWRTIHFLHNEPILSDSVAVRSYSCRQEFNCVLQLYSVESVMFWYMLTISLIYFVIRIRPWKFFTRRYFWYCCKGYRNKGKVMRVYTLGLAGKREYYEEYSKKFQIFVNISTDFGVVIFSRIFQ